MTGIDLRHDRRMSMVRSITRGTLWTIFVAALTLVFVYPVTTIILGSFRDGLPTQDAPFTLDAFVAAFTSEMTWRTLQDSTILVVVCGAIAIAGGGLFAWVAANTNVPGAKWLTPLMVINLFIPPLFHTMGWLMLGNRQNGLINQVLMMFGMPEGVFNIQTWPGLIMLLSLGYLPFAYLLMLGAFKNRDQALDEAAAISGAGTARTFFTITLPSVGPAITGAALLIAVLVFQSFDSPQIIGRQAGIYVFSTQIYRYVRDVVPAEYTRAFSLALILIVLVLVLFLLQRFLLRGRSFTTLTGKSAKRDPQQLGPLRWVFTALICVFMLLTLVLPLIAMILGSMQKIYGVMSLGLSLDNYVTVLTDPKLSGMLVTTAQLAILGGFGSMAVAFLTTYVVARKGGFLKAYTSFAVWISWALPGLVLALAYMFAILYIPAFRPLYGTAALMTIVLIVATIPVSSRIAEGALAQLSPELEEAGHISGAGSLRVLGAIVLRLVAPSFFAGWFLAALFIIGNLAVPMLLAPPKVTPVALGAYQLLVDGKFSMAAALFMLILMAAAVVVVVGAIVMGIIARAQAKAGRASTSLSHIAS